MRRATLQVTIMAAEELKKVNTFGKMSVYAVAWVEPSMKRATRIRRKVGKNPVWNDDISLPIEDHVLHHPHSALTIEVFSYGTVTNTLVGTTHFPLAEIARMKASKQDSEEGDIVTLPLHRPSGRSQGIIRLCINLSGASIEQMMFALESDIKNMAPAPLSPTLEILRLSLKPWSCGGSNFVAAHKQMLVNGFLEDIWKAETNCLYRNNGLRMCASGMPSSSLGVVEGIPVSAYYGIQHSYQTAYPSSSNLAVYPSAPPYVSHPSSSEERYPVPAPPAVAYYPAANLNLQTSPYVRASQPYVPVCARRYRRRRGGNLLLAFIGGAISGLLLGDILGGAI